MTFAWTLPAPLDATAKTLSIYITELQGAVNTRRAEISQAPISFIDQSVGKSFRLDAIDELETTTNQLALDYGYVGGVQNVNLLSRAYVTITKKYGKEVAHYPILNDLRQVLNLLVEQYTYELPEFVTVDWLVTQGAGSGNPDAFANFEIAANPFANYPLDIQTGVGGTCPEGPPTCPNTISGFFRSTSSYATDRSIIYYDTIISNWVEGPIGGNHNEIPGFGGSAVFDDDYFYDFGVGIVGAIGVYRWKRDGSSISKELIALFNIKLPGYAASGEGNDWQYLIVDDNYVYVVGNKSSAGGAFLEKKAIYGRATKTAASTAPLAQYWYDINTCQAEPGPIGTFNENPDQHVESFNVGKPFVKNGNVYVSYWDKANYRDVSAFAENGRYWYVGSCVAEITQAAVGGISALNINQLDASAPVKEHTAFPWTGPNFELRGGISLKGQSNAYLWTNRRPDTLQEARRQDGTYYNTYISQTVYFAALTYAGGVAATVLQDNVGTDLKHTSGLSIDTSEAYVLHGGGVTPDITVPNFASSVRTEGDPNDTIDVVWPATPGTFKYRVKWGTSPTAINFVGAEVTSDLNIFNASFSVPHGFAHYVKLELLTGQGTLLGTETIIFPIPIPPAPIVLSVVSGASSGELDVSWNIGSPWTLINGSLVVYRKVGDTGPWSSVEGGLTGAYTISGLIPGDDYDVKMRVYNDSGYSGLSNMLTGTAKL